MDKDLIDFLTTLNHVRSVDEAWRSTVSFMRARGAEHVGFSLELEDANPLLMWSLPSWVVKQWLEEVYPEHDPTVAHCRNHVTPFFSGAAFLDRHPEFAEPYKSYLKDIVHEEAHAAVALPVHNYASGDWGKFSLSTDLSAEAFERLYHERGMTVYMAAVAAFNRIRTLIKQERAADIGLTERERECLLWLARGMRNDQIAERMGIRPVTVALHLANSRRKLGARTREQALVGAVQLGLVEP